MVARDVSLAERTTQAVSAPLRFNLLGLHWQGSGSVDFRIRSLEGRWSAWRTADADTGPDLGSVERRLPRWHSGNLEWTGAAQDVQFRRVGAVTRLRAFYLWSKPERVAVRTTQLAGAPSIVTRASWEADEEITRSQPHYAPRLKLAVVHHTAGNNTYTPAQAAAIVRGIEVYHVKANGWNDIGYNFLVDRFGTVYEGRAGGMTRNVIGAHSLGFNTGTVGVALMGNHTKAVPSAAAQSALVRLLAWRLDLAHVDPLSRVVDTSSGNAKFKAGKVVTLNAISSHRDTGPSECPGARTYALLPELTRRVAATGLPKLYSVNAYGALGGKIRFQGRLSSAMPWTVTVSTLDGEVVARGRGRSTAVDWSWSSAKAGTGPFRWRIDAGPRVFPGEGTLGAPVPDVPKPAPVKPAAPVVPTRPPAPAPTPAPLPVVPSAGIVSGLTVSPATLTPASDGSGLGATVTYSLSAAAQVTVSVSASTAGFPLMTLFSGRLPAGLAMHQADIGILANGRYKVVVSAIPVTGGAADVVSADVTVDRTLGAFLATPGSFSPNGDGVNDTMTLSFQLTQAASVLVTIQRAGVTVATVFAAQVIPGIQTIGWDGTSNGARLPDGDYVAAVTATSGLGTVSLLQPLVIDTAPPALVLVDGATLRLDASENVTVTAVVNGQTISFTAPRGQFTIPWAAGPVTSFTAQARDAAGNAGTAVSWP
jgi:gliding motility-associated-like protein